MTLDTLTQIFKALSEPVRLRIVHLLLQRESLCVCDLVEILELNQSTVSRHLAYLKNSGMVTAWREGTWMHYSINETTLGVVNKTVVETLMADIIEMQRDLKQLQKYEKLPRACSVTQSR